MIKIDVPYIDQSVKYPTGCESVSAVMLLQYLGVSVTVDEFIEKYLELSGFEEKNGELYGPNPSAVMHLLYAGRFRKRPGMTMRLLMRQARR